MGDDPLDKETSIGVELTKSGVKANAKSRTVAAIDRLCGNLVDWVNVPVERRVARARAVIAGEQRIIEAVTQYGVERLGHDSQFAERAAEKYFEKVFKGQENTDNVVREAVDLLIDDPPIELEAQTGPAQLDERFIGPFERYAEQASTDELRLKWARVLSAEIRKPGLFSAKVLRIVDELDTEAAREFELLCQSRLDDVLPRALVGELTFQQVSKLTSAGLIHEPGLTGQVRAFGEGRSSSGDQLDIVTLGSRAFSLPTGTVMPPDRTTVAAIGSRPALPVYVLTDVGSAVATILPDNQQKAFSELVRKVGEAIGHAVLTEYRQQADHWLVTAVHNFTHEKKG